MFLNTFIYSSDPGNLQPWSCRATGLAGIFVLTRPLTDGLKQVIATRPSLARFCFVTVVHIKANRTEITDCIADTQFQTCLVPLTGKLPMTETENPTHSLTGYGSKRLTLTVCVQQQDSHQPLLI